MDFLGVYNRYKDILNVLFESKIKWDYDSVKEEASKYKTRNEFQKGCSGAYKVARKKGWLDDYDWFVDGYKRRAENKRKWNYESVKEEASKYKTRKEFQKGCVSAYTVARKKGWLDEWFGNKYKSWDYETVKEEASKYKTRKEFQKGCSGAYRVALKNGWLDDYDWFVDGYKRRAENKRKWNYETVKEEAMKYKTRYEFQKGCVSAYTVARKNGWLDEFTWLRDARLDWENGIDNVYAYYFEETNAIYVGRTVDLKRRDRQHIFDIDKDTVAKYAHEHNCSVPEVKVLETGLTLEQGQEQEHYWKEYYREQGYSILNKGKTGKGIGSLGTLGKGKWDYETVKEEASKYKTRNEFQKGCGSAYKVALKNGWLDEWFGHQHKSWDYETVKEEASKYKTRMEFFKGCVSAYRVARKNGWLDEFFPKC